MNVLTSQMFDGQKMMCQIHTREIIGINLDSSENGSVTYLCSSCLIEKINNFKILTIEHTKDQIKQYKDQRKTLKTQEIQLKLNQFNILLEKLKLFKQKVDTALVEIQTQIETQISKTEKENSVLLENCQIQANFQEDVKLLSEFVSISESSMEFQFIEKIQTQFEQFNDTEIFNSTIQTFQIAKQNIIKFIKENQFKLMPSKYENTKKTLSLSILCKDHKKEIILIDIDSKNKTIEQRLACAECIANDRQSQYRTIEKINDLWIEAKEKQDNFDNEQKSKRKNKQEKLNNKIGFMRDEYNNKLNQINENAILQLSQTGEVSKFKQISIQQLSYNELLSNLKFLLQQEKGDVILDEYQITTDFQYFRSLESQLEQLKQKFQLDIQEAITIVNDNSTGNQIQGIIQLSKQIQENTTLFQGQLITNEFISSSKQVYCQKELLDQSKAKFEGHIKLIDSIKNKIQQVTEHSNFIQNLKLQLDDYQNKFEKDFKYLKKFCEIDKLEESLHNLQLERNQLLSQIEIQDKQIKELELNSQNKDDLIIKYKPLLGLHLKPTLLKDEFWTRIFYILQERKKKSIQSSTLIFQGTKNGLNGESFWKEVNNKDNLLMIFKSESDYIFGAYTPCKWVSSVSNYVTDDMLQSFIFSQTHNQVYPLKQDKKQHAIYSKSDYGPTFGGGHDFYIATNFSDGYCKLGHSYQFDQYKNQAEDPHLFGQLKPLIKECEIYEISFI